MNVVWISLLTTGAAAAFAFLIYGLRRWPLIGLVSAALVVLIAWELPQMPPILNVGGNSVYLLDVLGAAFLIVGMGRMAEVRRNIGGAAWYWWAIGVLMLISLLRGISEFGLGSAVNEFRLFMYPFAALTWAMSLQHDNQRATASIGRFSVLLGWGLVLVSLSHIAIHGLGNSAELIESGSGAVQTTRPLVSGQALMLLMCAAVCIWLWRTESKRAYIIHAVAFGFVVMIVQQRTVWSVAILALAVVLIFGRMRTKTTLIGWFAVSALLLPILMTSSAVQEIAAQIQTAAENSSTYDARTVSWLNLISQSVDRGEEAVIFGAPMGAGFGRLEGIDRWVTFAPHNWYLTLYLRVGLLGLLFFLAFVISTFLSAIRRRANMASLAIIVMMAGYGWSYSWLWYSAVFAGWAYSGQSPDSAHSDLQDRQPESKERRLRGMPLRSNHQRTG